MTSSNTEAVNHGVDRNRRPCRQGPVNPDAVESRRISHVGQTDDAHDDEEDSENPPGVKVFAREDESADRDQERRHPPRDRIGAREVRASVRAHQEQFVTEVTGRRGQHERPRRATR